MTTEIILMNLRSRLNIITRQIERLEAAMPTYQQMALVNAGRVDALLIEQAFLTDLIAQIEREEVTP